MKNKEQWSPSKYVLKNGRLKASKNKKDVTISSRLFVDLVASFYQENIPLYVSGNLLDLGCGKVPLYAAYENYISDVTCVDWQNTIHKNPFLDIETDINQPLPIENENFDTVILSDVLEHIRKPEELIAEIHRIMKPNGKFMLNVPFFYWLHEQPFDYFRYTKFALQSMLEDAGFKVLKLEPMGGIPEIMTDIFCKNVLVAPVIGKPTVLLSQFITRLFLKTGIGKKVSKKTAEKFPLGYFVVVEK
ncbi:MAG: class I SAM-dependent methyltransferase [Vicingaceae bacterium]|nr:class I SAM-dependent methyltransferase [Vicingaceae bacterium]